MSSYPKIFSFDTKNNILLITDMGKEVYESDEVRQILLRKKRRVYHHKLVYVSVVLFFSIASVLFENSLFLLGILVVFSVFWMLPKYHYYLKLNFAINSKKYKINKKQFFDYKHLVQSFNKAQKLINV